MINGIGLGIPFATSRTMLAKILASITFSAPLKTTLVPDKGFDSASFTRASAATVSDFEGITKGCNISEARFVGARRVENLISYSEDVSNNYWVKEHGVISNSTVTLDGLPTKRFTLIDALNNHSITKAYFTLGRALWRSAAIDVTGLVTKQIFIGVGGAYAAFTWSAARTITISGTSPNAAYKILGDYQAVLYAFNPNTTTSNAAIFMGAYGAYSGDGEYVDITKIMLEDVTGQSNQNPSEYVSANVLSAPYHGANVDDVKYFSTYNGNSITAGILTEAAGAAIPDATILGFLSELIGTNEAFPSGPLVAGATCDTRALTAASYTLSFKGTGNVTGTGGFICNVTGSGANVITTFTGTATAAVATLTVSGSITELQLELGVFATSVIPTTSGYATRQADSLNYSTAGNLPNNNLTAYAEGKILSGALTGAFKILSGSIDDSNYWFLGDAAGKTKFTNAVSGVASTSIMTTAWSRIATEKAAFYASSTNGKRMSIHGVLGSVNSDTQDLQNTTYFRIGNYGYWSGTIRNVRIWGVQLSDNVLQALTA